MNLRLDYSEKEGTFKLSKPGVPLADQRGFMTLSEVPQDLAENFVSHILGNYPQLVAANGQAFPDFEAIQMEFQEYVQEDSNLKQKQLQSMQEGRREVFTQSSGRA